jgi:alcohol dehydrogenase (cytochrome c)
MIDLSHALPRLLSFALGLAAPAFAGDVTPERLLHASAEPENWLMNLGAYDGSRYSGLDAINPDTVDRLVVRYHVTLGGAVEGGGTFQAAQPMSPLVDEGFIYIVDGWGKVSKLDGRRSGAIVWQNDAGQRNLDAWLQATRGIALWRGSVLAASADGRLHWIDRETGETTRSIEVADPRGGYSIVAAPLVVGDVILVGGGAADRGGRGRIDAIDAQTGERLWHAHTIPAEGEAGSESWAAAGDAWRRGGGSLLQTGIYDPESGLTIWGAAHPHPRFDAASRPGANLFSNAALAFDVETGTLHWSHQYVAGGRGGVSHAGTHQFADAPDGRRLVSHFGNDGFHYVLTAADGERRSAVAHVERPAAEESDIPWSDVAGCPNIRSSPGFVASLSHRTGMAYGAGADGCDPDFAPERVGDGTNWYGAYYAGASNATGLLTAIRPETGEIAAQRRFDFPLHSGVLSTAGGLVFATTADGTLHALDDMTLETLWSTRLPTFSPVPPVAFAVNGEPYLAVVVGGNALAAALSERPPGMTISENLFVLVVLGLDR